MAITLAVPSAFVHAQPDEEAQEVARIFLDDVVAPAGADATLRMFLRLESDDRHEVTQLAAGQLQVRDNGKPVDPEQVSWTSVGETRRGTAAVLVLDASRSMRGRPFDQAKRAALGFLARMDELDQVAVVTFHDEIEVVGDFGTPREVLRKRIAALGVQKQTLVKRVWDGARQGLALIDENRDALPRRVFMLIFSDGRDSGSEARPDDIVAIAQGGPRAGRTPIFTVGFMSFGSAGLPDLGAVAQGTGGEMFQLPEPHDLDAFFEDISARMNQSLVVSYPAVFDGERHLVEVRVGNASDAREVDYPSGAGITWLLMWLAAILLFVVTVFMVVRSRSARPAGEIVVASGPGAGTCFPITQRSVRIGALDNNDIVLNFYSVSRHHAELTFAPGGPLLEDLNSRNGTYINDRRIYARSTLRPGDKIRLGELELTYHA